MGLRAFRSGCNVIALNKNNRDYGMVCAWATMIEYDTIGMLLGGQSNTGNVLEVGDICGVSALAEGQSDLAFKLGETHSLECNKFDGVGFTRKESAILINNAKCQMFCKVEKIVKLLDPADNFVILKVIDYTSDLSKEFLSLEDVYPEE